MFDSTIKFCRTFCNIRMPLWSVLFLLWAGLLIVVCVVVWVLETIAKLLPK